MSAALITSIRISTAPTRKRPKEGDLRWLKGRGVWQIRQQQRINHPLHGTCQVVSNGRPVFEWVDRGSDRDRAWRWTSSHGDSVDAERQAYFEAGCLCLVGGVFHILPQESNEKAVGRYIAECRCSRHPESGRAMATVVEPVRG